MKSFQFVLHFRDCSSDLGTEKATGFGLLGISTEKTEIRVGAKRTVLAFFAGEASFEDVCSRLTGTAGVV